jgi:hypothetical protein
MASSRLSIAGVLRILGLGLVGGCLIGLPTGAMAANNCAWINEATASGLLGGDAMGEVSVAPAAQSTVCTFTQSSAGGKPTLQVTVEIAAEAHARLGAIAQTCGADVARLTAIGNEALVCAANDRKVGSGVRVVGRVRDQVFTITIATTGRSQVQDIHCRRAGRWQSLLNSALIQPAHHLLGNSRTHAPYLDNRDANWRESDRKVVRLAIICYANRDGWLIPAPLAASTELFRAPFHVLQRAGSSSSTPLSNSVSN